MNVEPKMASLPASSVQGNPPWIATPELLSEYPVLSKLASCTSMRHLHQIHSHTVTTGAIRDNFVASRVLSFAALSPAGSLPYARLLFSRFAHPDPFLANTLLRAYAPSTALFVYTHLLQSYSFNIFDEHTFPLLLKACSHLKSLPVTSMIHAQVVKLALASHVPIQNSIVQTYASCGCIASARTAFDGICQFDDASLSIMVGGYLKSGCFEAARDMLYGMARRDVVSWSVMINWYMQDSRFMQVLELFREMLAEKLDPNESVLVSVLSACAHLGAVEQGRWVEGYVRKKYVGLTVRIGTALIDMYSKCGCVDKAFEVFNLMENKNAMTWSALIGGLAINGRGVDALQAFSEMEVNRVLPNEVTFISVLNACSHSGMVDDGLNYFRSMTKVYGIIPNVHHYCCLVDLYGRAGLLDKAEEVIKTMAVRPNSAVWGALLNSCRIHGNLLLGEQVGKKLLQLDPANSGRYVLLSNIYAANGRWQDVAELRRLMKEHGVRKTPGSSFIDLKGTVHEFIAGDNIHPQRRQIYRKLDEMSQKMKQAGFQPNTLEVLIDMGEEEKENALCHHSEKLALAFGLINADPGNIIRITKNLRVCADCHSVMKIVSKIYNCEIVVRDRNRFHHFMDGSCSCSDFW